jgi:hypothetical protein
MFQSPGANVDGNRPSGDNKKVCRIGAGALGGV